MKKNEWNEKLKHVGQKLGKFKYPLMILLLGVLLLAIPARKDATPTANPEKETLSEPSQDEPDELGAMEEKLSSLLSQMEGAGRVRVMLRYATGSRVIYQTDSNQEVSSDTDSKQTKTEIQTVMASGSGGQDSPVATQTILPTFQGALIVAEGAGNSEVKLNLVNAVSSLTGLGADKITVIKMKSE